MDVWTFVWLMLALKIPIGGLLWIVWWAVHQTTDEPGLPEGRSGGSVVRPPSPHKPGRPRLPRSPRRGGPHGAPGAPARVRVAGAMRTAPVRCVGQRIPA